MGLSFGEVKGGATKSTADSYKMKDGNNSVRLFGNILARYVYWIKGDNNKSIPVECLEFNRETETFDRAEKDWVKEYYPDLKASWSYCMMCLDENNKPIIFNFKKKLFEQIMSQIEDLGDPTDPENGWPLMFEKRKTGPLPINVEYTLQTLKCNNNRGPLTDEQKEAIAGAKPIEEQLPRLTSDQQKEFLEKLRNSGSENIDEEVSEELAAD